MPTNIFRNNRSENIFSDKPLFHSYRSFLVILSFSTPPSFCHVWGCFFMSLSDLIRQSRDPRNALRLPEDDRRKNNIVIAGLAFLYVMFGLGPDIHRFPGQAGE
jgi:hypothetical protein